jgi:acyl-CoA dehydrogenase
MSMSEQLSPWAADEGVQLFRRTVRQFIKNEFLPQQAQWRSQRRPGLDAWLAAGRIGMLLPDVAEEYGGAGGSFAHQAVVQEELAHAGVHFGVGIQAVVARYLTAYGTDEQRRRWIPAMARGELVAAIAMTEAGAGSDLQSIHTTARRSGDRYVINGAKTFITNGFHAGLVCLAAKTDSRKAGFKGISLILVETRDLPGYSIGPALDKVGMHGQDTCELFFNEVEVPAENLLGNAEGQGFGQMMEQLPYERLIVAIGAIAAIESALEMTVRYVKERMAFGKSLLEFQNTRFKLAECKTEAQIGRVFVDHCIERFIAGHLDEATSAMAKLWLTETQWRIVDECVQLHGGYGYMNEYAIARQWRDARVQRIYAGTNEIMKEVIAWSL